MTCFVHFVQLIIWLYSWLAIYIIYTSRSLHHGTVVVVDKQMCTGMGSYAVHQKPTDLGIYHESSPSVIQSFVNSCSLHLLRFTVHNTSQSGFYRNDIHFPRVGSSTAKGQEEPRAYYYYYYLFIVVLVVHAFI